MANKDDKSFVEAQMDAADELRKYFKSIGESNDKK